MTNYADRGGITPCEIFIIFSHHATSESSNVVFFIHSVFIHSIHYLLTEWEGRTAKNLTRGVRAYRPGATVMAGLFEDGSR